jgi:hypothetical protein
MTDTNHADLKDAYDIPLDPRPKTAVCRRERLPGPHGRQLRRMRFNIRQAVVEHSPTGMEWGYHGGGPADFALNILSRFLPPLGPIPEGCEDERRLANADVKCHRATVSSRDWQLHQAFKREFFATLPPDGGAIHGDITHAWIDRQNREEPKC